MSPTPIIAAELARIEAEAVRQSAQCLAIQDTIITAHQLVERLQACGACDDLRVRITYHTIGRAAVLIYPTWDDVATLVAIDAAAIPLAHVGPGYSADVTLITLAGYAGVDLFVRTKALAGYTGLPAQDVATLDAELEPCAA